MDLRLDPELPWLVGGLVNASGLDFLLDLGLTLFEGMAHFFDFHDHELDLLLGEIHRLEGELFLA